MVAFSPAQYATQIRSSRTRSQATYRALDMLNGAVSGIGRRIRERTLGGGLVRLDGKEACNGGPWGNNISASKTWAGDPIHCNSNRDRVQPPILRVDVACDNLSDLVWPDVFNEAQRVLAIALAGVPQVTDAWGIQYQWARQVMTLCSMAYEATNIQPIFYYPAAWATQRPRLAWGGSSGNPSDNALRFWGEYSAALTYDGRPECLASDGSDLRVIGAGLPRRIHQWLTHQKRQKLIGIAPRAAVDAYGRANPGGCGAVPDAYSGLSAPGITQQQASEIMGLVVPPAPTGLSFSREGTSGPAECATPSIFNGPWITDNSATMMALKGQSFDPWTTRGFGGAWAGDVYPLIPQVMAGGSPSWSEVRVNADQAERVARSFNGRPVDDFIQELFKTTSYAEQLFVPYVTRNVNSGHGYDVRVGRFGPSARWYVELAAEWAREIVSLNMFSFIADATLFYLVNHAEYYKRLYGPSAISIPADSLSQMSDAIRQSKLQMLSMPVDLSLMLMNFVNPIMGAVAGVVADIMKGVQTAGAELYSYPDIPKSLMRRLPKNLACNFSTSGQIGQAAMDILDESRGAGTAADDPPLLTLRKTATPAWLPWAAGAALVVGGALVIKKLRE